MKIIYEENEIELDVLLIGRQGKRTFDIPVGDTTMKINIDYSITDGQKMYREKAWLTKKYIKEGLSMSSIAAMCSGTPMTIWIWLDKFNIEKRSRGTHKA